MKTLIKKAFSMIGLGVYRLQPPQNNHSKTPPKIEVSSPIEFNSKESLNQFYSNEEAVESYLDPGFYDRLVDLLASHGVNYEQKSIADIGCGTGGLLKTLQNRFRPRSLTGFEYSENALGLARSKAPGIEFSSLDIYEGSPRQFDVIFCIEVLEHLLYPDRALRNIVAMLRDSGVALITVPNGRTDTFEGHLNFWSPESWDVFLKQVCTNQSVQSGLIENDQNNYAVIHAK